ncbi:MAG TPA: alpha/beta hydrolase [Woeseiaceae bacterium]|nr:alpha/beta hydrolase [Woeseiaceae bacterium]
MSCFPRTLVVLVLLVSADALADSAIYKGYADLSGGQVHYVTAGEGDVLLLLHQAPLSHAEFLEIIPTLAEHYKVIAWDAPGHGNSYIPPIEYEVNDYIEVLGELVEHLGVERAHVVGNHSGSAFAREFAANFSDKTGRVVLTGSARQPPNPKVEMTKAKEFLAQPYSRELSMDKNGDFLPSTWERYLTLASPDVSLDDVLVPFVIGLDARTKPYDLHLAVFRYKGWADPASITAPILLISGADDFFVTMEAMEYTCGLYPNCNVHPLIESAGAFLPLSQPDIYAAAILEFLGGE